VTSLRRLARRAGWGIADQAFSSLTNFVVGVLVARSVGATEFGAFSLAFATYLLALNVSRSLATEPLGVRFASATPPGWRKATQSATGMASVVGVLAGIVCLVIGWAIGGDHGASFLVLALFMPSLLVQDAWRYAFFAADRGRQAFLNDLVWALALVPLFGSLLAWGDPPTWAFMLAWGAGASVAAAAGMVQTGVLPRPSRTLAWLREQGDLTSRYLVELVAFSASVQLYLYGIGVIAGLAAVGAIRAGQLLLGPLNVLNMGIGMMAVPEASRALQVSLRRLGLTTVVISGVLAAGVVAWGLVVLLLPSRVGEQVLGPAWGPAREVLLPLVIMQALNSANTGAFVGLRALAAVRRSMRARLFASVSFISGALAGAVTGGVVGAAWGLAVAAGVNDLVWWWQLRRAFHDHRAKGRPAESAGAAAPLLQPE
jgi:O-antigen/teichoic acid export membrane protein